MRKDKGITLIEVVMSLALLALMVVPLGTLLSQGFSQYQRAGRRTQEVGAAAAFLEELTAQSYTELKEGFLCMENIPSENYPYIQGRYNFCQGSAGDGVELTFRLHLLMEPFFLNEETLHLEVLLVEVVDRKENLLMATYLSSWR